MVVRLLDGQYCLRVINYICDRVPFIVVVSEANTRMETFEIYRCPLDGLASKDAESDWDSLGTQAYTGFKRVARCVVPTLPLPPEAGHDHRYYTIDAEVSPRGFHVFHNEGLNGYLPTTRVHFWPIAIDNMDVNYATPCAGIESDMTTTTPAPTTVALAGMVNDNEPDLARTVASSRCGIYSATIVMDNTGKIDLYLLRRDNTVDPAMVHVRPLAIPDFVDLSDVFSIAVEERLGIIYLCNYAGYLISLPYA
ncbi:hypothetical protein H0H92_008407 [Tricholoma furcatifolium]|nr:hypothetical protein H0H92_008407 [Tricholoma furcatifolium]